jgi:hypothetical protein
VYLYLLQSDVSFVTTKYGVKLQGQVSTVTDLQIVVSHFVQLFLYFMQTWYVPGAEKVYDNTLPVYVALEPMAQVTVAQLSIMVGLASIFKQVATYDQSVFFVVP